MFKYEITYKNFNDTERKKLIRFNLSKDELMDLSQHDPDFDASYLASVSEEKDPMKMYEIIRKLIILSYGELSDDGDVFDKSDEVVNRFMHSAVYRAFLEELLNTDDDTLIRSFIFGIFPAEFADTLKGQIAMN